MKLISQATRFVRKEDVERKWYLIDARRKALGRLASEVAKILMGKHKKEWSPHSDIGDFVVVINAKDAVLTGRKWSQKVYHWHSGYPGGLKSITAEKLREKHPERLIIWAVKGMLPKNFLRKKMLKRLRVYAGSEHPYKSQVIIHEHP